MVSSKIRGLGVRWLGASTLALALGACGSPGAGDGVQTNTITSASIGSALRRDVRIVVNRKKPGGPRGFAYIYRWLISATGVRTASFEPGPTGSRGFAPGTDLDLQLFSCLGYRIASVTQIATASEPNQIIRSHLVDGMHWSLSTTDGTDIADGTMFSVLYDTALDPSCSGGTPTEQTMLQKTEDSCPVPGDISTEGTDRPVQSRFLGVSTHTATADGEETCTNFGSGVDPSALLRISASNGKAASARYVPDAAHGMNPWCIHFDDPGRAVAPGDRFEVQVYSSADEEECGPSGVAGPSDPSGVAGPSGVVGPSGIGSSSGMEDDAKDSEGEPKVLQIDPNEPELDSKGSEADPKASESDPKGSGADPRAP